MGIYQIVTEMPRQQCHQRTEVLLLSFIIAAKLSMAQSTIGRHAAIKEWARGVREYSV